MKKFNKGFTLIELLVVIAIIGILATLATISLGDARASARDAKRISDVKQMATILELAATMGDADACTGATNNLVDGGCAAVFEGFDRFEDPNGVTLACTNTTDDDTKCQYGMYSEDGTGSGSPSGYSIYFVLEKGVGDLEAGLSSIETGAIFVTP